jgi:hypothetical protein
MWESVNSDLFRGNKILTVRALEQDFDLFGINVFENPCDFAADTAIAPNN